MIEEYWKKLVLILSAPACILCPMAAVFHEGVPATNDRIMSNFKKLDEEWKKVNK